MQAEIGEVLSGFETRAYSSQAIKLFDPSNFGVFAYYPPT